MKLIRVKLLLFVSLLSIVPSLFCSEEEQKVLFAAIEDGDLRELKEAIALGADVNRQTWSGGITPLMEAIKMGRLNIVQELVRNPSIDINRQSQGGTPLIYSLLNNRQDIARELLKHPNIEVNRRDSTGRTALHYAMVFVGAPLQELFDRNADVNQQDVDDGNTLLISAVRRNRLDHVRDLLKHPNIDVNMQNNRHETALSVAVSLNRPVLVGELLAHSSIDINRKNEFDGGTVLMLVVNYNRPAMVTQLLDAGADINIKNDRGETAWTKAVTKPGIRKIIRDFIERKKAEKVKQLMAADQILPGDVAREIAEYEIGIIED